MPTNSRIDQEVESSGIEEYQQVLEGLMQEDYRELIAASCVDSSECSSQDEFDHVYACLLLMRAAQEISRALDMQSDSSYEERKAGVVGAAKRIVVELLARDSSGWLPDGAFRAVCDRFIKWGYDEPKNAVEAFAQFAACFAETQIQLVHAMSTMPEEMIVPATAVKEASIRLFAGIITPNSYFKIDLPFNGYESMMSVVNAVNSEEGGDDFEELASGFDMQLTFLGAIPEEMLPAFSRLISDPQIQSWANEAAGAEFADDEATLEDEVKKWNERTDSYMREKGFFCDAARKDGREPNDEDVENDSKLLSMAIYFLQTRIFDDNFVMSEEDARKAMQTAVEKVLENGAE